MLLAALAGLVLFAGASLQAVRMGSYPASAGGDPVAAQARAALVAYNLDDADLPGALPCPDFTGDGVADIHCQAGSDAVYVERLPWRTLDRPRGEGHLWYALDRRFRDNPSPSAPHAVVPLNSNAQGKLRIDGDSGFAAVVVDPGDALAHQDRAAGAIGAYLEGDNADGDRRFTRCRGEPRCNDRVLGLRPARLFAPVRARALTVVADALADYAGQHGRYPWAAPLGAPAGACERGRARGSIAIAPGDCPNGYATGLPRWLRVNQWHRVLYYAVAPGCATDADTCQPGDADLLRLAPQSGRGVVWAAAGPPIRTAVLGRDQDRRGPTPHAVQQYLDHRENVDGDAVFTRDPPPHEGNDRLRARGPP